MFPINQQRGVALYITFMVVFALLGIVLGTSTILISQFGVLRGIGYSVLAFYATEAGVERALYIDNTVCLEVENHATCLADEFNIIGASPPGSVLLSNGASYQLKAESPGDPGCTDADPPGYNFCVRAEGNYKEVQRAVRVAR